MSASPSPSSTFLYRHFAKDDALLYVGISLQAIARLTGHRSCSPWAHLITRIEIEAFDSREEALEAEARAIAAEKPRYNINKSAEGIATREKTAYRRISDERRALWPSDVERRYGVSAVTRWRWEKNGRLPARDVHLGDKAGWRPETLDAHERRSATIDRSRTQ